MGNRRKTKQHMLVFCLLDDNVARGVRDMGIQLFAIFIAIANGQEPITRRVLLLKININAF